MSAICKICHNFLFLHPKYEVFQVFNGKNMYLIADAGSTKTHWCLVANNGDSSEFFTEGINPFFQSAEDIRANISDGLLPQMAHLLWVGPITEVYFYGAGCTPEKSVIVEQALAACFRKATIISVESDMLGAAHALFGKQSGVACILGTGSNSCQYDGEKFVKNVPALGFILGDEGSGAALGKKLVADLLKNQLGSELKEQFLKHFDTNQAEIIDHVYRKPFPNRYLASLSRFAADNLDNPMIAELVYDHFNQFVIRNLKQYSGELPVGFVGSIAYYYKDILQQVMSDNQLKVAKILQSPISELKNYHHALRIAAGQ